MKEKLKILIVDPDKKATPYLIEDLTETYSFSVTWLSTADNVMETLQNSKFDAVISSVIMPIPQNWDDSARRRANKSLNTGLVLLEKIRQQYPNLPVVVMSTTRRHIKNDGFTIELDKPSFIKTIVDEIKKLIR